jgi:hypothetical protein
MALTWFPYAGSSSGEDKWELMEPTWIGSGIIQGVGNELAVYADSTGMRVKVPSGRAWLDGTMANEDAAGGDIIQTITAADPTNPRIDRVVLRRDFVAHTMAYVVIPGTPAVAPVPPGVNRQPQGLFDLSLAQVRVNAGAVTIAAGNVTDERSNPAVCGWAAQANTALLCTSAVHPATFPRGGQILELDTATLLVNTGTFAVPVWTALQLGAVTPETFYTARTVTVSGNYPVAANVMFVFCLAGVLVTLPAANVTARPITVAAVSGNTTVNATQGSVVGGSVDTTSGAVLNGAVNQGDIVTYKAHTTDGGTTWVWRAVY